MTPRQENNYFHTIHLISIGAINITPENKMKNYDVESFGKYILEYLYKKDSLISSRIDDPLKKINELKTLYYYNESATEPALFYDHIYGMNKDDIGAMLHYYNPERMKREINEHLKKWEFVVNHFENVDIQKEISEINTNLERLDKLEEFKSLHDEIVYILEESERIDCEYNKRLHSQEYYKQHSALSSFMNDPDRLINQDHFKDSESFFEYFEIDNILMSIREPMNNILNKILETQKELSFTQALSYKNLKELQKNSATDFISNLKKQSEFKIRVDFKIEMSSNQKISEFICFDDESILVKDNKNNFIALRDNIEAKEYIKDLYKSYIDFKLKKNPTLSKLFQTMIFNNFNDMKGGLVSINTVLNNENILKAQKFDIMKYKDSSFEKLDDAMNATILDHKIRQYANSIASNKYRNLYNEKTYELFKEIYELKLESSVIQNLIGKKMAIYKTPEEFNERLTKLNSDLNGFNKEAILFRANAQDSSIAVNDNNLIVLKVNNFEQSESLGSASWCIARHKHYFDSYTSNNAKQYFVYDFSKESKDVYSLIGMTLSDNGEIHAAHLKDDDSCSYAYLRDIQLNIIKCNLSEFPNLSKSLKDELNTDTTFKLKPLFK